MGKLCPPPGWKCEEECGWSHPDNWTCVPIAWFVRMEFPGGHLDIPGDSGVERRICERHKIVWLPKSVVKLLTSVRWGLGLA